MAKIRLKNVTVSFGSVEIDDVQIPTQLLQSLEVTEDGPSVKVLPDAPAEEEVKVVEKEEPSPIPKEIIEFSEEMPERKLPSTEDFADSKRLRDVVRVFHEAGFKDEASIVEGCRTLKAEGLPILKHCRDIGVRIPIAIAKLKEDEASA